MADSSSEHEIKRRKEEILASQANAVGSSLDDTLLTSNLWQACGKGVNFVEGVPDEWFKFYKGLDIKEQRFVSTAFGELRKNYKTIGEVRDAKVPGLTGKGMAGTKADFVLGTFKKKEEQ